MIVRYGFNLNFLEILVMQMEKEVQGKLRRTEKSCTKSRNGTLERPDKTIKSPKRTREQR